LCWEGREKKEIGIKRQGDLDARVLKKPTKPNIISSQQKASERVGNGKRLRWGRRHGTARPSIHTWRSSCSEADEIDEFSLPGRPVSSAVRGGCRVKLSPVATPCRCRCHCVLYYFSALPVPLLALVRWLHPIQISSGRSRPTTHECLVAPVFVCIWRG